MSKLETPMTVAYWNEVGGTLIEEFRAVRRTKTQGQRLLDGLILVDGPKRRASSREDRHMDITGMNVIVIQTKASRLGMYLMGQAIYSKALVERLGARCVRTVALCTSDDDALGPIAREAGIDVVVRPGRSHSKQRRRSR